MHTLNKLLANKWLASDPDHKHPCLIGGGCDRPGEVFRNGATAQ